MVVAARAGEALAEECLGRVFGQLDRILVQHEIIKRAILPRASGACKDFACELVPRLVLAYAVADPVVEGPHRVRPQLAAGDEQQIRPFIGPIIDELFTFEQPVDHFRALIRRFVGEEGFDVFGSR